MFDGGAAAAAAMGGTCSACGASLAAGSEVLWSSEAKTATCAACAGSGPSVPVAEISSGVAGASAQREYERRAGREQRRQAKAVADDLEWRTTIKEQRPVLGRVAAALTAKPAVGETQPVAAWSKGAAGERRVGEVLDDCTGVRVLHDRRMPRSKANIDHLAVGPAGVFVIDAKRYEGAIERRDVGGWLRTDDRLYIGTRDRSKVVAGVRRRAEVVRGVLDAVDGVAPIVVPVLCFVGVEWPRFFRRPLRFGDVVAVWPDALRDLVSKEGSIEAAEVDTWASVMAAALPPA